MYDITDADIYDSKKALANLLKLLLVKNLYSQDTVLFGLPL